MKKIVLAITIIGIILFIGIIGLTIKDNPQPTTDKELISVSLSSFTVTKEAERIVYDVYCVYRYKDGTSKRESLGKFTLSGENASNIILQTDRCSIEN